jgi:hypothetical protein
MEVIYSLILTYLPFLVVFAAIGLPLVYLIKRYPDLSFWLLVNIMYDPGGYLNYYYEGKLLGLFYMTDIVIFPIIFCLYVINANYKIIFKDQFLIKFLKVYAIFVAYYFIFYGGIIPYLNDDLNYALFLQKNRTFFYYIIVLLSTYIFALRGLKYFYITTLITGFIILSAFLVSLVTHIDIVPISLEERYEGSEMMRIGLYSWGLYSMLFPIAFIIFLFSRKIKLNINYKRIAYITGMLMAVTLLVALSRRNFISIPGTLLIIIVINSYIFRKSTAFALAKISIPLGIVLMIISLALPKYIDYIAEITQDTFQLVTGGTDTRGEKDYRVSGTDDLEITKKYINDNLLFGTGYSWLHWEGHTAVSSRGSIYSAAMDAAGEVPVYYIFFGFGLTGFIIMVFLYSFLIRLFFRLYSLTKRKLNLLTDYPYEILFILFILYLIANKFTFSLYTLGGDFTSPNAAIFVAVGFALLQKLKIIASSAVIYSHEDNRLQEINTFQTLSSKNEK